MSRDYRNALDPPQCLAARINPTAKVSLREVGLYPWWAFWKPRSLERPGDFFVMWKDATYREKTFCIACPFCGAHHSGELCWILTEDPLSVDPMITCPTCKAEYKIVNGEAIRA